MAEVNIVDGVWSESDNLYMFIRPEWQERAACKNMLETFFSEHPANIREAKNVCKRCPVKTECENYAANRDEFGVWAGKTATERRRR